MSLLRSLNLFRFADFSAKSLAFMPASISSFTVSTANHQWYQCSQRLAKLVEAFTEINDKMDYKADKMNNLKMRRYLSTHEDNEFRFEQARGANLSDLVLSKHATLKDSFPDEALDISMPINDADASFQYLFHRGSTNNGRYEEETHPQESLIIGELYHSAKVIHSSLQSSKDKEFVNWPLLANDVTVEQCKKCIPPILFNMIAVIIGASDKVPQMDVFLDVNTSEMNKLSICLDILYLYSKGQTQTSKSLALGLSLRHLTGSSEIVDLIHKFGHCASYDTVMRYETVLANRQVEMQDQLPDGFSKHVNTAFVWDNIDFTEETATGGETTHHTNGTLCTGRLQQTARAHHSHCVTCF